MGLRIGSNNASVGSKTVIGGVRTLANIADARKVPQIIDEDIDINGMVAPLQLLIKKLGKKKDIHQNKFGWVERDMLPLTLTLNETMDTTETGMDVATGTGGVMQPYQIWWYPPTNELVEIVSVSTDTATIVRAVNGDRTTGYAMTNGDELQLIGSAHPENSTPGSGVSVEPKIIYNYPQTFRQYIQYSRRDEGSENYGIPEKKRLKGDCLKQLMCEKELCYMFSTGAGTVTAADVESTTIHGTRTNGALHFFASNVHNLGGPIDNTSLETYCEEMFRRNSKDAKNLYAMCGPNFMKGLDSLGRDNLRQTVDDTKIGLDIMSFQCSFGSIKAVLHPLFTPLGSNAAYTGAAAGTLDPGSGAGAIVTGTTGAYGGGGPVGMLMWFNVGLLGEAHYAGQTLEFQDHIEAPGTDGTLAGFIEDVAFIMQSEKQHLFAFGINAP